ncbi:hypothetical protein Ancab_006080 [Ancistrocladus abbreviatus]
MAGEKRGSADAVGQDSEFCERVKMRNLESVVHSEGIYTHYPESSRSKGEASQITKQHLNAKSDTTQETLVCIDYGRKPIDLNSDACTHENSACNDTQNAEKLSSQVNVVRNQNAKEQSSQVNVICKQNAEEQSSQVNCGGGYKNDRALAGIGLDLNAEYVPSSADLNPFRMNKTHGQSKSRDASECGSSTGPLEPKDPLRIWKEMKQNGFLSPSYGGIPLPKQRGRKGKNDVIKKKIEQAKKEQVHSFTKLAAPAGLLHGLNPGIIHHVRNSKQVRSIIEALVKYEEQENRHAGSNQGSQMRSGAREIGEGNREMGKLNFTGEQRSSLSHVAASFCTMPGSRQMHEHHLSHRSSIHSSAEIRGVYEDLSNVDGRKTSFSSNTNFGEDILALKLSSSTSMFTENTGSLTNEESGNLNSVDSLSVKAATVASQWLQLLYKDVRRRLAALQRSRKRVQAVITTELPLLLPKEFSSNQENDPCVVKGSAAGYYDKATADLHQAHWSMVFNKMDGALAEEEKQLVCWRSMKKIVVTIVIVVAMS